jgi:hypothetical protein
MAVIWAIINVVIVSKWAEWYSDENILSWTNLSWDLNK